MPEATMEALSRLGSRSNENCLSSKPAPAMETERCPADVFRCCWSLCGASLIPTGYTMLEVFWRTILRGTIANEAAKEMPQFSDVFVKTQKRGLGFAPAVT